MRRPLLKLVILVLAICGTAAIAYSPLICLNLFGANFYRTRAFGWSDPAYSVLARPPYGVHVDRILAILPFCPSVKEVSMPPMPDRRRRLARLAKSPWIISLDLSYSDIVDDDLAELAGMAQLEYLYLEGNPKITDVGIAHLAKCTKLRFMNLTHTNVTGTGFAALADCQELRTLDLSACPVTDETVVLIPRLNSLQEIYLDRTRVTDTGVRHFLDFPSLEGIYGSPHQISDEFWQEFKRRIRERDQAAGKHRK